MNIKHFLCQRKNVYKIIPVAAVIGIFSIVSAKNIPTPSSTSSKSNRAAPYIVLNSGKKINLACKNDHGVLYDYDGVRIILEDSSTLFVCRMDSVRISTENDLSMPCHLYIPFGHHLTVLNDCYYFTLPENSNLTFSLIQDENPGRTNDYRLHGRGTFTVTRPYRFINDRFEVFATRDPYVNTDELHFEKNGKTNLDQVTCLDEGKVMVRLRGTSDFTEMPNYSTFDQNKHVLSLVKSQARADRIRHLLNHPTFKYTHSTTRKFLQEMAYWYGFKGCGLESSEADSGVHRWTGELLKQVPFKDVKFFFEKYNIYLNTFHDSLFWREN